MTTAATTHPRRSRATRTVALLTLLLTLTIVTGPAAQATETRVRATNPTPAVVVGAITAATPTNTGESTTYSYDNTAASTVATNGADDFANYGSEFLDDGARMVDQPLTASAVDMAGDWLGPNARMITNQAGDKIFLSADGTRRLRFDINRPYPHSSPHAHVEELVNGTWVKSGPIYPTDVPHN